jgi:tetratricopeptide (TPR) repeat protein
MAPDRPEPANGLAWLLATCPQPNIRNGAKAIELAGRAVQLSNGREPDCLDTLAAAYAEAGRFPEAVQTARKTLELAAQLKRQDLAESVKARIILYEAGSPFRETQHPLPQHSVQP